MEITQCNREPPSIIVLLTAIEKNFTKALDEIKNIVGY